MLQAEFWAVVVSCFLDGSFPTRGVTIPLVTGSESGSGIAKKAENLTPDPDPGPES